MSWEPASRVGRRGRGSARDPGRRLWQHVTRAIREGDQLRATQEKSALEEAQRQRSRERQQSLTAWLPQLFQQDPVTQEWRYRHEE